MIHFHPILNISLKSFTDIGNSMSVQPIFGGFVTSIWDFKETWCIHYVYFGKKLCFFLRIHSFVYRSEKSSPLDHFLSLFLNSNSYFQKIIPLNLET